MSPFVLPIHCPHCQQPLPPPVSARTLEAARALARMGGEGSSLDLRDRMGITRRRAGQLLAAAAKMGLVEWVGVSDRGAGRRPWLYRVNSRLLEAYE
jgi:hypothetical protein